MKIKSLKIIFLIMLTVVMVYSMVLGLSGIYDSYTCIGGCDMRFLGYAVGYIFVLFAIISLSFVLHCFKKTREIRLFLKIVNTVGLFVLGLFSMTIVYYEVGIIFIIIGIYYFLKK